MIRNQESTFGKNARFRPRCTWQSIRIRDQELTFGNSSRFSVTTVLPGSVLAGVAGAPVHQGVALLAREALGAVAQEVALPALACGAIPA